MNRPEENLIKFDRCPRCKGALLVDRDQHGWYEQCLHCGYQRDLEKLEVEKVKRRFARFL